MTVQVSKARESLSAALAAPDARDMVRAHELRVLADQVASFLEVVSQALEPFDHNGDNQ